MNDRSKTTLTEYEYWASRMLAHPQQCPDMGQACHAWLSRLTEAASIASDMDEAERLSGRNPRGALSREIPLS